VKLILQISPQQYCVQVVFQYWKQWNQRKQNSYFLHLHLHLHVEPEQKHHHIVKVTLVIVSDDTEDFDGLDFEDGEHSSG
jgi:hypothetical protein